MATTKTFTVAGVSTNQGVTKVRFANDFVARIKILDKNGHTDVNLKEFDTPMTKAQVCETLMNDASFQDEASQGAISEFVVRNCKTIAAEIKDETAMFEDVDQDTLDNEFNEEGMTEGLDAEVEQEITS
tara:strand:+ start:1030 stop:1416 length:387 start_codon:yes stop_codon:yes gene_type:complete